MSDLRFHRIRNSFQRQYTNPIHRTPQRIQFRRSSRCSGSCQKESQYPRFSEDLNLNDLNLGDSLSSHAYQSIFNSSNSKNILTHDTSSPLSLQPKTKTRNHIKKHHTRIESLDILVKHCESMRVASKTSRILLKHNRKACNSIKRIKKDIESCQKINPELASTQKTERNLKMDAQILRLELGLETEKHQGKRKKIWKFATPAITKKTERLIQAIEKHFESRKNLKK
ncbi:hypothetical protein SteCoe_17389 [Stentor coeruleus]|uniref:Uncharacterized protein n=1 Tax=Stentor coeruleus TaxID=5963 RepID=A0A1R2BYY6_9CILI|nr:hypothetical protein SteCoe_17389 [Stentor coeruleus]